MSRKYKFSDQNKLHFVTFTTVNWIDVFTRDEYRAVLLDSLRYCQTHKGLEIYAWCIMTNHMHMIIGTNANKLQFIIRDFKAFTSRSFKEVIAEHPKESRKNWIIWMMERVGKSNCHNNSWQFWQQDSHPIELFNTEMMKQKLEYIHLNPVRAGFVSKPEDWLYSSAVDYAGEKGFLDVILVE